MKPTIKKGPASHYEGPQECIREITSKQDGKRIGALISVRRVEGELHISVYRYDEGVIVNGVDLYHGQPQARD